MLLKYVNNNNSFKLIDSKCWKEEIIYIFYNQIKPREYIININYPYNFNNNNNNKIKMDKKFHELNRTNSLKENTLSISRYLIK